MNWIGFVIGASMLVGVWRARANLDFWAPEHWTVLIPVAIMAAQVGHAIDRIMK